ncbi:phage tail assembly chaperone [Enterocloster clostridioformis]|uniref:Phage XkdN-like tail assembly chaperone protein, TAC n=1 Tax=Enterocloster clostridioformis TaxID=1531 RepID=A0A1I0KD57_9FIRM|nr:hypothetical protein [Enterocloster clostridioformis]SEU22066.1 Phage XkdN-like tail assembly chaperone protein, TAC [Enterocloster clostridioformis]SEW49628.1 Phage XkdN-like tail assembly chaperone protein, TAC [Enterocloster clostridioformis]
MGDLSRFLKKNKKTKANLKIAATTSFLDDNGKPLLWEIRPLTTKEDNALRDACTVEVPVTGKPGMFRPRFDGNKYLVKMAAACIVSPNLNDKELQDSYGVMGAEQLIVEMIDNPGEFNAFMDKIQEFHGFKQTFQDKVEEAKN